MHNMGGGGWLHRPPHPLVKYWAYIQGAAVYKKKNKKNKKQNKKKKKKPFHRGYKRGEVKRDWKEIYVRPQEPFHDRGLVEPLALPVQTTLDMIYPHPRDLRLYVNPRLPKGMDTTRLTDFSLPA